MKMAAPPEFDDVYAQLRTQVSPFAFDETVAQVFPDMIARSVPGYGLTLPLIGLIARRYAQPNSVCYDLGCSLGAVTLALRHHIKQPGCRITAVDNAPAMVARLRQIIADDKGSLPVDVVEGDIQDQSIANASVVVLHFTLQFLDLPARDQLIQRIYNGLNPGGALILSEKVVFAEPAQNARFMTLHHDFKQANGYSRLEISQKRTALENVLIPETMGQHQERLQAAGFSSAECWFQAFNFVSLLAIKKGEI